MFPLIRMTWTLNRRFLLKLSPWLALDLVIVLSGLPGTAEGFASGCLGLAALLVIVVLLRGLASPPDTFLLALPVTRAQVVRSRYLVALLTLVVGLLLPVATAWAAHLLLRLPAPPTGSLAALGRGALGHAAGLFLFLPFFFFLGHPRGLIAFAALAAALLGLPLALWGAGGTAEALAALSARSHGPAFPAAVGLCGLASLRLSLWGYRRNY